MTDTATILDDRFGAAFAVVVNEALSWSPEQASELRTLGDDTRSRIGGEDYDYVTDTVYTALLDAGLAEYDCDLDADQVPAGWVEQVRRHTRSNEVAQVAWAVLARDRDLISTDDFVTLTDWWQASGLPLPARDGR
ncbi:hypothetical protein [Plantactinospora sp. WMMB782]|uniref:hypothetical protein n=1 Tax=Plantactinospora sp. WMMB782 TaxID=3404121 RepID=UPI003B957EDC